MSGDKRLRHVAVAALLGALVGTLFGLQLGKPSADAPRASVPTSAPPGARFWLRIEGRTYVADAEPEFADLVAQSEATTDPGGVAGRFAVEALLADYARQSWHGLEVAGIVDDAAPALAANYLQHLAREQQVAARELWTFYQEVGAHLFPDGAGNISVTGYAWPAATELAHAPSELGSMWRRDGNDPDVAAILAPYSLPFEENMPLEALFVLYGDALPQHLLSPPKANTVLGPIRVDAHWHLLRVHGFTPPPAMAVQEIYKRLQQAYLKERMRRAVPDFLRQRRAHADVEFSPELQRVTDAVFARLEVSNDP